jgi:hypothetical protein
MNLIDIRRRADEYATQIRSIESMANRRQETINELVLSDMIFNMLLVEHKIIKESLNQNNNEI